jgi:hypothetical protein
LIGKSEVDAALRGVAAFERIVYFDFDRFLDAAIAESEAGFGAVGFEHEFQGVAESGAAFAEGSAVGDRAWDLFDPAHEPPVLWPDDGVESLSHGNIVCVA